MASPFVSARPLQQSPSGSQQQSKTPSGVLRSAVDRFEATTGPGSGRRWVPEIRVLQPGLSRRAAGKAHYGIIPGYLFGGDLNSQKNTNPQPVNACLAQAMSEVARAHPQVLNSAFRQNGDGTLTVRLYAPNAHGAGVHPVDVTIDRRLPICDQSGRLFHEHSHEVGGLWASYLEKAYAALQQWTHKRGGYDAMRKLNGPVEAMMALTGNSAAQAFCDAGLSLRNPWGYRASARGGGILTLPLRRFVRDIGEILLLVG